MKGLLIGTQYANSAIQLIKDDLMSYYHIILESEDGYGFRGCEKKCVPNDAQLYVMSNPITYFQHCTPPSQNSR